MIGRGVFSNPFAFARHIPEVVSVAPRDETRVSALIDLLNYHLDLFDQYQPQTGRPYETLKRFYKIYIRDFDGASEVRHALMQTHSTLEARAIISDLTRAR